MAYLLAFLLTQTASCYYVVYEMAVTRKGTTSTFEMVKRHEMATEAEAKDKEAEVYAKGVNVPSWARVCPQKGAWAGVQLEAPRTDPVHTANIKRIRDVRIDARLEREAETGRANGFYVWVEVDFL